MAEINVTSEALMIEAVETRALLPALDVIWRSVTFRGGTGEALAYPSAQGMVRLELPPDLRCAVPKRKSEFLAGRLCAALALRELGAEEYVGREGRAPIWPAGVTGSISHRNGRAMAVVSDKVSGLGLDCETVMTCETLSEVQHLILNELDQVQIPSGWSEAQFCTLAFSAKEAVYKVISNNLTDIPDFREARMLEVSPAQVLIEFRGKSLPVLYAMDGVDFIALAVVR